MPILKIGKEYYNGNEQQIYLMQGSATRDAEDKHAGGHALAVVSIAAQSAQDGSTTYVTLNGWRSLAAVVRDIRKGDSVLAVGRLKQREYNEKTYWDMDADFISVSGSHLPPESFRHSGAPVTVSAADFNDISDEEDGKLPF